MSELDLSRYAGHTTGDWRRFVHHQCAIIDWNPRTVRGGSVDNAWVLSEADVNLLVDAPKLLAEIARLREEASRSLDYREVK